MQSARLSVWHVIGTPPKLDTLLLPQKDHGLLASQSLILVRNRKQQSVRRSVDLRALPHLKPSKCKARWKPCPFNCSVQCFRG